MGRFTPQLIEKSPQFTNTLQERELDLRGNTIDQLENLGATKDVFDSIDLSDNRIKRIEGIPLLSRLKTLLLCNNHINFISESVPASLPNLESLVLTKNYVQDFGFIDTLQKLDGLLRLSLVGNPIASKPNYRNYVIYKLPLLKVLDFNKITQKDRKAADLWAESEEGVAFIQKCVEDPGFSGSQTATSFTEEEKEKIKIAIQGASSLEEIARLKGKRQTQSTPDESHSKN